MKIANDNVAFSIVNIFLLELNALIFPCYSLLMSNKRTLLCITTNLAKLCVLSCWSKFFGIEIEDTLTIFCIEISSSWLAI